MKKEGKGYMIDGRMKQIDLKEVKTYPLGERPNLVGVNDMVRPGDIPKHSKIPKSVENTQLKFIVERIIEARRAGRSVIWMMDSSLIESGLSLVLIDLLKRGMVTHVAGNGAVSIHDFELALIGETCEDAAAGVEEGTYGMTAETGEYMHRALREGSACGLGYGASLGRFMSEYPELFHHRDASIIYNAYTLGIPVTMHVAVGADGIHFHPDADFSILGESAGTDLRGFAAAVGDIEEGVFLGFGTTDISTGTGAQIFLNALAVARNLGHSVTGFLSAHFAPPPSRIDHDDAVDAPAEAGSGRPAAIEATVPSGPISKLGGASYRIRGDYGETVAALYNLIVQAGGITSTGAAPGADPGSPGGTGSPHRAPCGTDETGPQLTQQIATIFTNLRTRRPELEPLLPELRRVFHELVRRYDTGGILFLCGNGGSMADALHISGELLKSYARPRTLPPGIRRRLQSQPDGEMLVRNLEPGLGAWVLGANLSLSSAVANDMPDRDMAAAQELMAAGKPGDILLGISTSGNARNVVYAAQTARALGMTVISLTGKGGGRLGEIADIGIHAPAGQTDRVQEYHVCLYHALCEMLEIHYFGEGAE